MRTGVNRGRGVEESKGGGGRGGRWSKMRGRGRGGGGLAAGNTVALRGLLGDKVKVRTFELLVGLRRLFKFNPCFIYEWILFIMIDYTCRAS